MVRAHEDRVALEERVDAARSVDKRADAAVGLDELLAHAFRPVQVRREVEIGEVVDEQVEAVARDEPAACRGGVLVHRSRGAVAHGERRADRIRLVQVVEEEAARPERRRHEAGNVGT